MNEALLMGMFMISALIAVGIVVHRSIEVSWNITAGSMMLRRFDPYTQHVVSWGSAYILAGSLSLRRFVLEHVYHVSKQTMRFVMDTTRYQQDTMRMQMRGKKGKQTSIDTERVSPFLREMSRYKKENEGQEEIDKTSE